MSIQERLFKVTKEERKRSLCGQCYGHKRLCGKPLCPILTKAKTLVNLEKSLSKKTIFGASPPAVFVGSWNYPKVLAGPLVPPFPAIDSSVMDLPEMWLNKSMEEILRYRFTLVRGKRFINVKSARDPKGLLPLFQEVVMSSKPTDTEMWFNKKPRLNVIFSSREPPSGPTASIKKAILAENPKVPLVVDKVVSDTDLRAVDGVMKLYNSEISQRQITRVMSIGLLGTKKLRRLVPTEWSITAIDDMLGKQIHKEIINYPWINNFLVFGHRAFGNNIQILLFPSSWMFEAQEAWVLNSHAVPSVDYEFIYGRKKYANNLAGAYYASRLPILEYLKRNRRQAGAIVFMEVYPEWIPLGVWRFREISREALRKKPLRYNTLNESLEKLQKKLQLPLESWLQKSQVLPWHTKQRRLTSFLT
jgi:hypothetical protein